MISDADKQGLREFLQGKLSVEDNLNQDFIHGFASAAVWGAIESGMSPRDAVKTQVAVENVVEEVLHSLRGGSINRRRGVMLTAFLRVVGWCFIIFASLFFLVFTILPLLDTNDSVVFEAGTFGLALGRFVGLVGIGGVLPLLIARRRSGRRGKG